MGLWKCIAVCAVMILAAGDASPSEQKRVRREKVPAIGGIDYLKNFGYVNTSDSESLSVDGLGTAIRAFQRMAHIPLTGILDDETLRMMNTSRCGVKDKWNDEDEKLYVPQGSKWNIQPNKPLTYRIIQYTRDLSRSIVNREISRAFKVWSDHIPVTFKQVNSGTANIVIKFVSGSHGDGYPFDGRGTSRGNILAHAFYPESGGDAHFDEAETWTYRSHSGKNLFQVAAHEFGHSLGLKHSGVKDALMAPFYRRYMPNFKLHQDDINGIQYLYATPSYCKDSRVDDVTPFKDGFLYFFRGAYYHLVASGRVWRTYSISARLPGVPNYLNAVLYWPAGYDTSRNDLEKLYFFKGRKLWILSNGRLTSAKSISSVFPGLPSSINTAFVWSGNGMTYFARGTKYYRVGKIADSRGRYKVQSGYPKSLSVWGFSKLDGAFQSTSGNTYFFVGQNYYLFDAIAKANPPYPRPTSRDWYYCGVGAAVDSLVENPMNVTDDPGDGQLKVVMTDMQLALFEAASASSVTSSVRLIILIMQYVLLH